MKALLCLAIAVLIVIPAAFGAAIAAPGGNACSGASCVTTMAGGVNDQAEGPFGSLGPGGAYARQEQIFLTSDLWAEQHTMYAIAMRPDVSPSSTDLGCKHRREYWPNRSPLVFQQHHFPNRPDKCVWWCHRREFYWFLLQ